MEANSSSLHPGISIAEQINRGVEILRNGGVIGLPTDTVFGLAARAFDVSAVQRIFRVKGRLQGEPLPLLLADIRDFEKYATNISQAAWTIAEAFLPGPLTLVFQKHINVPDVVTGGKNTVALRVPDHPVPRSISTALETPITGTSANRSGEPSLDTARNVMNQLGPELDFVIDDQSVTTNVASTVLDVTNSPFQILRQGVLSYEAIRSVSSNVGPTIQ